MRKNSNVFKTLHYWEPCDLVSDKHIGACPTGLHDVDLGSPTSLHRCRNLTARYTEMVTHSQQSMQDPFVGQGNI